MCPKEKKMFVVIECGVCNCGTGDEVVRAWACATLDEAHAVAAELTAKNAVKQAAYKAGKTRYPGFLHYRISASGDAKIL
jgi:hypothetical protein